MGVRIESDSMGKVEVPSDKYWGAQTQRSLQNFKIGGHRFGRPRHSRLRHRQEGRGAHQRVALGKLDATEKATSSCAPADEVIAGKLDAALPARRLADGQRHAVEHERQRGHLQPRHRAGRRRDGIKKPIHPNDDVNQSQSSNDVFPTVMHVAAALRDRGAAPARGAALRATIEKKAEECKRHREGGPHAPHGRDAAHARAGVLGVGRAARVRRGADRARRSIGLTSSRSGGRRSARASTPTPKCAREVVASKIAELTGARLPHRAQQVRRAGRPRGARRRQRRRCAPSPSRASRSRATCASSGAARAAASASSRCPRTSRGAASCPAR